MGFSRQEYWSGLPFHSPGDLPNPGIEPRSPIDILGISELRWTGMGQFNSDDHYIYDCGQESLRRNGVAIIVLTNESKMQYLDAILKTTE